MGLSLLSLAASAILISTQVVVAQSAATTPAILASGGLPEGVEVVMVLDDMALLTAGGASWLMPASSLSGAGASSITLAPSRVVAKLGTQDFEAGPWVDLWGDIHWASSSFTNPDGNQNAADQVLFVTATMAQFPPAAQGNDVATGSSGDLPFSVTVGDVTHSASSGAVLAELIRVIGGHGSADSQQSSSSSDVLVLNANWLDAQGVQHNVTTRPKKSSEKPSVTLNRHLEAVAAYQKAFPPAPVGGGRVCLLWTGSASLSLAA
ncbi:MAG: hypothetical protein ACI9EF_001027 [Pseudohongiellaceae bacterium]|jgi:hypothetical protein